MIGRLEGKYFFNEKNACFLGVFSRFLHWVFIDFSIKLNVKKGQKHLKNRHFFCWKKSTPSIRPIMLPDDVFSQRRWARIQKNTTFRAEVE